MEHYALPSQSPIEVSCLATARLPEQPNQRQKPEADAASSRSRLNRNQAGDMKSPGHERQHHSKPNTTQATRKQAQAESERIPITERLWKESVPILTQGIDSTR